MLPESGRQGLSQCLVEPVSAGKNAAKCFLTCAKTCEDMWSFPEWTLCLQGVTSSIGLNGSVSWFFESNLRAVPSSVFLSPMVVMIFHPERKGLLAIQKPHVMLRRETNAEGKRPVSSGRHMSPEFGAASEALEGSANGGFDDTAVILGQARCSCGRKE